jgi:hypothetical protein
VCPNCHAVIHRREPPFTIHEVQKMLKHANNRPNLSGSAGRGV